MLGYARICWDMLRYVWICRDMLGHAGICLDMLGYVGICSDMSGYAKIRWDMLRYAEIYWFARIYWNMVGYGEYGRIWWDVLGYGGTWWDGEGVCTWSAGLAHALQRFLCCPPWFLHLFRQLLKSERASRSIAKTGFWGGSKSMAGAVF